MKVQGIGKLPANVQEYTVVRGDGTTIVFKLQPADMSDFIEIVEEPQPPVVTRVGKASYKDYDDPQYLVKRDDYQLKQTHFFILSTLAATEQLEWETVDLEDPDTWGNYETELRDFGLLPAEVTGLVSAAMRANSMDSKYIDEMRKEFLAGKGADQER